MREPFISEALENEPAATEAVGRNPSYPDRARIDSDVRAFLRPVSTPWIVFDRDSKVDDFAKSALRIGAIFASSPSFRPEVLQAAEESGKSLEEIAAMPLSALPSLSPPSSVAPSEVGTDPFRAGAVLSPSSTSVLATSGVFPPASGSSEIVVEPSNVVVASDVAIDSSSVDVRRPADPPRASRSPEARPSRFGRTGRALALGLSCAGIVALVSVTAVTLTRGARSNATSVALGQVGSAPPAVTTASPLPIESAPVEVVPAAPLTSVAEPVSPMTPIAKVSADPKKRFGRLSIRAEAKHKNVWFDGKRMLGSGQRSFLVFCGMHTIAVADKTDTKDVEIPCDGEYIVFR